MATPAAPTTGIEIKLDNGMVIKGATPEEALQSAAKIIQDNVKSYRETKEALETLQGQFGQLQQQVQSRPEPSSSDRRYGKEEYFRTFADDPLAANDAWFEQRFGAKPSEVAQQFGGMQASISSIEGESLAAKFLQRHADDFPASPENAKHVRTEVERLTKEGHPPNLSTMEIAYTNLVERGEITPLEAPQQQEDVPPTLQGGSSVQVMPDEEFAKLSTTDMEKYLRAQGRI